MSSGRADVALLLSTAGGLARALRKSARQARATIILEPARVEPVFTPPTGAGDGLVLGPGSGLWTPRMRAGILAPSFKVRGGPPCLIISQGCAAAEQLVLAARRRGLRILAALSTGQLDDDSWSRLAAGCAEVFTPSPLLLLALHRPVSYRALDEVLGRWPRSAVLMTTSARLLPDWTLPAAQRPPDARDVARALGRPVLGTASATTEAAHLLLRGIPPADLRVQPLAEDAEEAALLEDMMKAAGLDRPGARCLSAPILVGQRQGRKEIAAAARVASCAILGHRAARRLGGEAWRGGPAFTVTADSRCAAAARADTATLEGLAALDRCSLPEGDARTRPARTSLRKVRGLLDGWAAALNEVQVKEVLACYGINAPPEGLATSASRAGVIADQVGLPVAVKAVGPDLHDRLRIGAVAARVESVSACRQAFRDVLLACSQLRPPPLLDGVMVTRQVALPSTMDCGLFWCEGSPCLMSLGIRGPNRRGGRPLVRTCPQSLEAALAAARDLVSLGLEGEKGALAPRQLDRLAAFIHRLSWLGEDLAGRMSWLRLDTVSPPAGRAPPLVIDGRGMQTASYRAPRLF